MFKLFPEFGLDFLFRIVDLPGIQCVYLDDQPSGRHRTSSGLPRLEEAESHLLQIQKTPSMKRYVTGLLIFSILIIIFGLITGKITVESFQVISLPGLLFAVLKSLVVVLVLLLGLAAALPGILIDVVMLFVASSQFPITGNLWSVCWKEVTLDWFWTETSGSSLFFGAVILAIISGLLLGKRKV